MLLYVGRSSFKSLRAGSQVFTLLVSFLCVICHYVCKNYVGSMHIGGYGGLSESGLCVFRELCPVSFLVVGESPLVVCSHVTC